MATGTFIGHARGFGFVTPDAGGEDIFIPASETMGAMQKDRVLYKMLHKAEKGKKADGVIVRILERGQQRIVGTFEAGSKGYGFVDLSGQGAVVGAGRVTGKVRLPVACIGGGDAPHAAAGRHGTGQPAQRNAHAHAALQDGHRQGFLSERQHSSLSAWIRCLPPFHRSSRMSATGRTSWSIPAT